MEDVLELYSQPYDVQIPVVCMDEASRQHVKETRIPIQSSPGFVEKYDCEYERNGVSSIFMFFEPLTGQRHVYVKDHRTQKDWAYTMKELVDVHYPNAAKIRVVMDNLNTHKVASLYLAFAPEEALRIAQRLELHYTPKHGSWLNMAEIELGVLSGQCLDRRIPDRETMDKECQTWAKCRNAENRKANWQFKTKDARIKLRRLYPVV
jgi:hypothetical protein